MFLISVTVALSTCFTCNITDVEGAEATNYDEHYYDYETEEWDGKATGTEDCKDDPIRTTSCPNGCTKIDMTYKNPVNG